MALTVAGSPVLQPAVAAVRAAAPDETDDVPSRPDSVSAMVTARAQDHRVEDLSQRSQTTQVFANPDGSWTSEAATDPVRVKDDDDKWHDIDTTLVAKDGGLAPKYAATDVVLSGGGDKTFASMSEDGKDLDWKWPTNLPVPDVDGDTATYKDVAPGQDLVVKADPTGFEHSIVLKAAPDEGSSTSITTPIVTDGAKLAETADGGVSVTSSGDTVVAAPTPMMYDSSKDENDDPVTQSVDASVGKTAAGTPEVTLTPDMDFLSDPDTVYPVTIDPSWSVHTSGDTWAQTPNYDTPQVSSTELRVGTYDNGVHKARAFLHFGISTMDGKHITNAKMVMSNWDSATCTGSSIRVRPTSESWAANALVWDNQPAASGSSPYADYAPAKGASGCPAGDATWDVTSIVQGWQAGSFPNYGVRVVATNENSTDSWRHYRSGNYLDANGTKAQRPRLDITYNSYPGTASAPTVAPAARYATGTTPSTAASYTSSVTPTFSAKATDSDGGTVRLKFEARTSNTASATLAASCTTGYVAEGMTASCAPTSGLSQGSTYYLRTKAYDGSDWSGKTESATSGWSSWTKFVVASGVPAAPVVSCPSAADGSWATTAPASDLTCTITAAASGSSGPVKIRYSLNGATEVIKTITQSADPAVAKTTVTVPKTDGGYDLRATAQSPTGLLSDDAHYRFGYGKLGMAAPAPKSVDTLPVTTGALALDASGPPVTGSGASSPPVKVQWRLAASGDGAATGWNDAASGSVTGLQVTNDATSGARVTGRWDTMSADHDAFNLSGGSGGTDLDDRKPAMIDVQVCVTYASGDQCTWSTNPRSVMRVPHAFGNGFPTQDVDAGEVALWTGEFSTDATDVSVPGFSDDLSLSRTATTYAGAPTKVAGVFGPGWTAQLDGPEAGLAGMQLVDNTRTDGTLVLEDGDGTVMVFGPKTAAARRSGTSIGTRDWQALDQDTILAGTSASSTVTGTGASQDTTVTFTEADGTKTTFNAAVEPTASTDASFAPSAVNEPGAQGVTSFEFDTAGRVTRIWQAPSGISCTAAPASLPAGCRVLRLDYAADDTTTTGEAPGQVRAVWMDIYNPSRAGGAGMDSVKVAAYTYDSSKRLTSVTDPRSNLTTGYAYDATSSRLASITPPGLKPVQLEYAGAANKLVRVKRERPATDTAGGTATLDTILYDVPVSGTAATDLGLPSLSALTVQTWGQSSAPTYAAAVFGPDKPLATLDPAQVTSGDWRYADLTYTDARGYAINTAGYGTSGGSGDDLSGDGWQFTYTGYDEFGNVVRELDEGDIAAVKNGEVAAPDAGTTNVYNTEQKDASGNVVLPAGSLVTDTYGPVRQAVIGDGSLAQVRPHTHTDYDQGAPTTDGSSLNPVTGQTYGLATTETVTSQDAATGQELQTLSTTKTGYAPVVTGDTSGWVLGASTSTTTVLGGSQADIVSKTRYDSLGRVIETRQPMSSGTDAGTRRTSYYTASGTASSSNCDGRPEWAGLPCVTDYAGAPSSGPALTSTRAAAYSMLLDPTSQVETSGAVTRTTTTSYLADGRTDTVTTGVTGLPSSTAMPGSKTTYDTATGLATRQQNLTSGGTPSGDPISTGYDTWGRAITYSPAVGETTTTSFTAAGDVASVTDPKGTTAYTYNGTDAGGRTEYRGLATKLTVSNPGGATVAFTGAYDADGTLGVEKLPGGLTRTNSYDIAGEPTAMTYSGTVTADGQTQPDQAWLSWSQDNDVTGRVRLESTPAGAAFDGDLASSGGSDGATGYSRVYDYDQASRLTKVVDNTAVADSDATTSSASISGQLTCQTRSYGFDANGNRTSLGRTGANTDGSCASSGGATKTSNYDTADRLTVASGYAYDALGRATTVPAADTPASLTPGASASALTLGYYDDDSARTLTQTTSGTTATTTYSLDAAGRRSTSSTVAGTTTTETTARHYSDDSDNPAWNDSTTGSGSDANSTTTRYAESLGGDLAAAITTGGAGSANVVKLPLVNPHGDTVTTVTVPASGAASGIDDWTNTDEYGNPQSTTTGSSSGGLRYGWLGGKQRATDTTGLILMGARLYNPSTGAFTSDDPIYGGNSGDYTYPQDPVNEYDLNGQWGCRWCKKAFWGGVRLTSWRSTISGVNYAVHRKYKKSAGAFWGGRYGYATSSGIKHSNKRWGNYGRHTRIGRWGRFGKGLLRGVGRFSGPVSAVATVLDYGNYPGGRRRHPWAPGSRYGKRKRHGYS